MGKVCFTLGREESALRILVGKCKGNKPFGKTRKRRNYDIKINFKEMR
jgi:hypothetical protein